jgi:hypothetical protein
MSCTLPAVIWICEALVEEDEAEELEDTACVEGEGGGSSCVFPGLTLWE